MKNKKIVVITIALLAAVQLSAVKNQLGEQKNDAALKPAIKKEIPHYKTRKNRPIKKVNFTKDAEVHTFELSAEEQYAKSEHFKSIAISSSSNDWAKAIITTGTYFDVDSEGQNYIHQFAAYSYPCGLIILLEHLFEHEIGTLEIMINEKTNDYNLYSPLHIAAQHNLPDTVEILLKYGATIQVDGNMNTPLHHAANLGYTECTKVLLAAMTPQEIELASFLGHTALSLAQEHGHQKIANLITERLENNE